jgi:ABC-three component (ABC-3C) system Middle Component 2
MMSEQSKKIVPFNSPLETGLRSVCVLAAGYSMRFDLQQLLAFDHLVVHSGDMENAPPSLHPKVSHRNGELLVRRPLVERGLLLMESKNLVEKVLADSGFYYTATEFAPIFIESLTNEYMVNLYSRADWAVKTYQTYGSQVFREVFDTAFDRWTTEFQFTHLSLGGNS